MLLYFTIVYVPKINAATNKNIKFWSIAPPGGAGGGATGGGGSAKTLDTLIKVIKNANKTVFVIFINLNPLRNNRISY